MGEPRHQDVHLRLRAVRGRGDELLQRRPHQAQLAVEPEAGVGGDLVVAAAPRVQLAARGADDLAQAALVGGVDVLVPGLDHKRARAPLRGHGGQPFHDRRSLLRRQHPRLAEGLGVRLAALRHIRAGGREEQQALVRGAAERATLAIQQTNGGVLSYCSGRHAP